jgi:four helix bundle protein
VVVKNDLQERTKAFALQIIDLVEHLPKSRSGEAVARQLIRSGTSIGANYREANRAQSKDDFIHKVALATKEASETAFWLELISESSHLKTTGSVELSQESRELLAILTTIGKNANTSR